MAILHGLSMLAKSPILVFCVIINPTLIGFEETSTYCSVQISVCFSIGHHLGIRFTGTDRNGPNYRI